jgi:hypothetical protein
VSPDITGTATMVNITTSGLINTLNIRKSSLGIYAGDGTPSGSYNFIYATDSTGSLTTGRLNVVIGRSVAQKYY